MGRTVLHLCAAREVKSGDRNRGTGGSGARGAQPGGGSQPGCPGAGRTWARESGAEGPRTRSSRARGLGLRAQLGQQPRQVVHQVPLLLDLLQGKIKGPAVSLKQTVARSHAHNAARGGSHCCRRPPRSPAPNLGLGSTNSPGPASNSPSPAPDHVQNLRLFQPKATPPPK